jgi:hypothetical protein
MLMKSAGGLTVDKALETSIIIEDSVAEQHYISAITLSNPEVKKLFDSLASFDCSHFLAIEDFARRRGFSYEIKKSEYIESCKLKKLDQGQRPGAGQAVGQAPADIPQEFIDRINHLYVWHSSISYYKLLGVRDYAPGIEIRESYHRMAKEFHPDLHADMPEELRQKLGTIFSIINLAYSTLMDPEKRREYDRTLGSHGRIK